MKRLSDSALMAWSRMASEAYERNPSRAIAPPGLYGPSDPRPEGVNDDIEGAQDVSTLMPLLFLLTRYIYGPRPKRDIIAVEIGTHDGSTALPILKALAEVGGHLHSVDPYRCEQAHRLVDTFEYRPWWTHHQIPSDTFFETFDEVIDFGFVDGDHRWPVVERDIRNLYERLRPGGMIVVSDYEPLFESAEDFEGEHDGSTTYVPHVACDPVGDKQMTCGIAKAAHRVFPTLSRAQTLHWPVWPNPSLFIRKLVDGELDPAKPHVFKGRTP